MPDQTLEQSPAAPRPRWFPTASVRQLVDSDGGGSWTLHGVIHAREVGSPRTVCGLPVVSWPMLFDRAFDESHVRACKRCAHVTGETNRLRKTHVRSDH